MKRVLMFVESFLPGNKGGGPVTSIANLVKILEESFDICIVTKNYDIGDRKPYSNILPNKIIRYKGYNVIYLSKTSMKTISRVVKEFDPHILYMNGLFPTTTQLVMLLNKAIFHKKLVIAPRGELQENGLKIKRVKKSTYLYLFKLFRLYIDTYFHSTDKIETNRIRFLFGADKISEIPNAVGVKEFKPITKDSDELRMIFISRITKKKNLDYALSVLRDVKVKTRLDIYGPKEDIKYWGQCEKLINKLPDNIQVQYRGNVEKNKIYTVMRKYHAFLFPTRTENFGHVIVEAMQSGLVPVISDQTPWLSLKSRNAGWDIALNNKEEFVEVIEELYSMDEDSYLKLSAGTICYIQDKLNMDLLSKKYIEYFEDVISQ